PLSGDVRKTKLTYQLGLIKLALGAAGASPRAATEVVMIYYQGGERVAEGESYLRLRTGRGRDDRDVVAVGELAAFFADSAGAQVFLLDVTRTPDAEPDLLTDAARVGLLRFAWRDVPDASPREAPDDARLITALGQTLPDASTLEDVASGLSR